MKTKVRVVGVRRHELSPDLKALLVDVDGSEHSHLHDPFHDKLKAVVSSFEKPLCDRDELPAEEEILVFKKKSEPKIEEIAFPEWGEEWYKVFRAGLPASLFDDLVKASSFLPSLL